VTDDGPWLDLPQAVVLEATRDINLALDLADNNEALLVIKANQLIALRTVIQLRADADEEQRLDALRRLRGATTGMQADGRYLEAQKRVHGRLAAGVSTKASRTPGGPCERVDPVEFTRVELRGVDAIDKRTQTVSLYDLRINGFELVESLTGKPISPVGGGSSRASDKRHQHSSQEFERWDCTGDPVPKLIGWARSRWGEDGEKVPNRQALLLIHREQFGRVPGVNEKTMAEVRREVASRKARRGGAPTHRR
jgi:hypothetical protein